LDDSSRKISPCTLTRTIQPAAKLASCVDEPLAAAAAFGGGAESDAQPVAQHTPMQRSRSCDVGRSAEPILPREGVVDNQQNRYDFKRFLGKGGFGNVYLVENVETKERLALKVIQKANFTKPHHRDKVLREIHVCFVGFCTLQTFFQFMFRFICYHKHYSSTHV
jgi:hypothetical protein